MHPKGLTLSVLVEMALGRAEMLGMTKSAKQQVIAYDPLLLQGSL